MSSDEDGQGDGPQESPLDQAELVAMIELQLSEVDMLQVRQHRGFGSQFDLIMYNRSC